MINTFKLMIEKLNFNFNKPNKKVSFYCDYNRSKEAVKEDVNKLIEEYAKIAPVKTLEEINITDKSFDTEFEEYKLNKQIITNYRFIMLTPKCISAMIRLRSNSMKIIDYVVNNIEYNTNIIILNTDDICKRYNMTNRTFYSSVVELDKANILWRTNKHSIYVINPFMIYKGSIIKWYNRYITKYNGELAKTNDKGVIILDY